MKKLFCVLTAAFSFVVASAQKVESSKIPSGVKEAFAKEYPKVSNPKWEMEKGKYEANFHENGKEMAVLYGADGSKLETETEIKVSELPESVTSYIKEHYKGKNIKEAEKVVKTNGEINYEAEVGGKELVFDSNGKYIGEEKE